MRAGAGVRRTRERVAAELREACQHPRIVLAKNYVTGATEPRCQDCYRAGGDLAPQPGQVDHAQCDCCAASVPVTDLTMCWMGRDQLETWACRACRGEKGE